MDPVTAIANMLAAAFTMISKMIDGQTPDQKVKMWDQWIANQDRFNKFFHIGE